MTGTKEYLKELTSTMLEKREDESNRSCEIYLSLEGAGDSSRLSTLAKKCALAVQMKLIFESASWTLICSFDSPYCLNFEPDFGQYFSNAVVIRQTISRFLTGNPAYLDILATDIILRRYPFVNSMDLPAQYLSILFRSATWLENDHFVSPAGYCIDRSCREIVTSDKAAFHGKIVAKSEYEICHFSCFDLAAMTGHANACSLDKGLSRAESNLFTARFCFQFLAIQIKAKNMSLLIQPDLSNKHYKLWFL
ncbi:hypothetical protein EDB19DRAFT_1834677 [Suillus lakei]|nr:hypothetical protein EDB19DRAFT_1834677 [Suillus lakei]